MWTSDEGAALRGTVRLFGSLWHCGKTFEDPYWRAVLVEMANGGRQDAWTLQRLRQRFGNLRRDAQADGADSHYWQHYTSFNLQARHEFLSMAKAGLFHQGGDIKCRNCGSHYWIPVERLRRRIACLGCAEPVPLSPEMRWSFRLNELVATALAGRGTLAVIQALYTLQEDWRTHGMFLWLPCQNLGETFEGPATTDVDILAIKGRSFILGEVKSSPSSFTEDEMQKAASIADEFRPDELIFAAPGEIWPAGFDGRLAAIGADLAQKGVRVRQLRLRWN